MKQDAKKGSSSKPASAPCQNPSKRVQTTSQKSCTFSQMQQMGLQTRQRILGTSLKKFTTLLWTSKHSSIRELILQNQEPPKPKNLQISPRKHLSICVKLSINTRLPIRIGHGMLIEQQKKNLRQLWMCKGFFLGVAQSNSLTLASRK